MDRPRHVRLPGKPVIFSTAENPEAAALRKAAHSLSYYTDLDGLEELAWRYNG